MADYPNFYTLRLGKTSVQDISRIDALEPGVQSPPFQLAVVCKQVPRTISPGGYALIWLGSDNSKGMPTAWKQGFRAIARIESVDLGAGHNDDTTTRLSIGYVFESSLTKTDLLEAAPAVYVRYSEMALFGMDDYANQTIRVVEHSSKSDIGALLLSCDIAQPGCFQGIVQAYPELAPIIAKEEEARASGGSIGVSKVAMLDDAPINRNMIVHGAPGTGKSHYIEDLQRLYFDDDKVQRVTFYPNYSYAQFVGGYKPYSGINSKGDHEVYYRFVFGPFLDTYVAALKHPEQRFLLIIEEINRANAAAVFGDVFQLLDRGIDGTSEYPVRVSHEMGGELYHQLNYTKYDEEHYAGFTEQEVEDECVKTIALPSNMFIWATMNSADQGVFPIDTAFRRRWSFEYLSIDNSQEVVDISVNLAAGHSVSWNALRMMLNEKLLALGINEDKQIGPFFIGNRDYMNQLQNENRFNAVFKDKVITYLFNDVVRHCRLQFFTGATKPSSYSQVCADFDLIGERIFGDYDLSI